MPLSAHAKPLVLPKYFCSCSNNLRDNSTFGLLIDWFVLASWLVFGSLGEHVERELGEGMFWAFGIVLGDGDS